MQLAEFKIILIHLMIYQLTWINYILFLTFIIIIYIDKLLNFCNFMRSFLLIILKYKKINYFYFFM